MLSYLPDRRRTPRDTDRRHSKRLPTRRDACLVAGTSLLDAEAGSNYQEQPFTLYGETRELSESGASIVIHSFSVDERACAEGQAVQIVLELPKAQVSMEARLAHCKQVNEKRPEHGYLLGADVIRISEEDRELLREYLKSLHDE